MRNPIYEDYDQIICTGPAHGLRAGARVKLEVGTEEDCEMREVPLRLKEVVQPARDTGNYRFTGRARLSPGRWSKVTGFFNPHLRVGMMKKVV